MKKDGRYFLPNKIIKNRYLTNEMIAIKNPKKNKIGDNPGVQEPPLSVMAIKMAIIG